MEQECIDRDEIWAKISKQYVDPLLDNFRAFSLNEQTVQSLERILHRMVDAVISACEDPDSLQSDDPNLL